MIKLGPEDLQGLYGNKLYFMAGHKLTAEPETIQQKVEEQAEPKTTQTETEVKPEPPKQEPAVVSTPPAEAPISLKQDLFNSGEAVNWKLKAGSRLGLVLLESEFSNRVLTGMLKQHIVAAGIPVDQIGFGIITGGATHYQLQDMSLDAAIVFMGEQPGYQNPQSPAGKTVYHTETLSVAADDAAKGTRIQEIFKTLKAQLGL